MTQVLVVFAIRTRRPFFKSKPHLFLVAMAIGSVAVAVILPLRPAGKRFGFVAPAAVLRLPDRRDGGLSGAGRNHQRLLLSRQRPKQKLIATLFEGGPTMPKLHKERRRTGQMGWMRAAALGANDGIISMASLVLGCQIASSRDPSFASNVEPLRRDE